MKILVTGAKGLLGEKLTTLLDTTPGIDLVATARNPLPYQLCRGKFIPLDITDPREVSLVIEKTLPDVVINTAAMTQVDQCETERGKCWLANVTAVEHLAHACKTTNAKLIHISTDFIFDGTRELLQEDERPAPVNYYGESKLAGEEAIKRSGIDWAIARTVLVYGVATDPGRSNIVLWAKKSLEEGKPIHVVNDQWRTPTLAEDLAMGCYLMAIKNARGVFHISGEELMTPYDIVIRTAKFFKLDATLVKATDSTHFRQPALRPLKTGFNIGKAKNTLGYAPHTFIEGLGILEEQFQKLATKK